MTRRFSRDEWAVILGGSSGFGLASALRLSRGGMSVAVVHRDRRSQLAEVEARFEPLRRSEAGFFAVNSDALAPAAREATINALRRELGETGRVRLLLHSIAWGNLKPLAPGDRAALDDEDFAHTVHAMGTSLATWTRELFVAKLFAPDARVLSLSSEGSHVAWDGYAAVSAAKAALEAVSRSIAVEYARYGVRANVIQAGVADTPALRRIPESDAIATRALRRNPFGRLTRPEDVADVVYLLACDEARWINGAVLRVDGGEQVAG
jgi:enoyl-[acyl-carrier protein] reductase I